MDNQPSEEENSGVQMPHYLMNAISHSGHNLMSTCPKFCFITLPKFLNLFGLNVCILIFIRPTESNHK